jgi:hypothetical protein
MNPLQQDDRIIIFIAIYCFVEEFLAAVLSSIEYALDRPNKGVPPQKKHNLSLAYLITLALFRFFTGHPNWHGFYCHIKTYHLQDFPNLPTYRNFIAAINNLAWLASWLLEAFCSFFRDRTTTEQLKLADSSKLAVCHIKREFSHKVAKRIARKSKGSMGWFYGFKLHLIVNQLQQILGVTITTGNTDDRKGLALIWNYIFGLIVADAGYVGANWEKKAASLGKRLFTGVRANMKQLMTEWQHQLLNLRQIVETVLSVLKLRMGLETTLPRSELGYLAHYVWCLTAYQLKRYFSYIYAQTKPGIA